MKFSALYDEPSLHVSPTLATKLGLELAVIVQRIHFLLQNPRNGRDIDGHRWVFNTLEEWHKDHFPFIPERSLRRYFDQMEEEGVVMVCQPDGRDRRKYYRLNEGFVNQIKNIPCGQIGQLECPNWPVEEAKLATCLHRSVSTTYTEQTEPSEQAPPRVQEKTPEMLQIEAWFKRRATTPWSSKELKSFKSLGKIAPEDLTLMHKRYTSRDPNLYRRQELYTLLNNWNGELDKARNGSSRRGLI